VLVLMLEATQQVLTVLPTHRLLRGIGQDAAAGLLTRAGELFDVQPVEAAPDVIAAVAAHDGDENDGLIGLWTRAGGALLTARRSALEPYLPAGGDALRSLEVSALGVAMERLAGIDDAAVAAGAIDYTKSAAEAIAAVDRDDGVDAAFLLEPTPISAIEAVAREGDVMPQKSTYFYPKALTGLVINPHEW
jgi:hypothetical protein